MTAASAVSLENVPRVWLRAEARHARPLDRGMAGSQRVPVLPDRGDGIEPLLSWHQVQTDEELAADLQQVKAAGLIPEEVVRWCITGDGSPCWQGHGR
jgi:hypothetical protein